MMGDKSNIEWTHATWNPIVGCSVVSPGCTNCYAMRQARRIEVMSEELANRHPEVIAAVKAGRSATHIGKLLAARQSHYHGTTKVVNGKPVWTGKVALARDYIVEAPLRWKKPRRIFVTSMGDLFHESIPSNWIDRCFAVMAVAQRHTFQLRRVQGWEKRTLICNVETKPRSEVAAPVWGGKT